MSVFNYAAVVGPSALLKMPRVGYKNLFREGVVNVSSQEDAHPKEQAFNGKTFDAWRTIGAASEWIQVQHASQNTDYMALAAHTLMGCTIKPQRSNDGLAWTDNEANYVVPNNRPIVFEWTSVASAYSRLLISGASGPVSIGAIHVGLKTSMLRGFANGWMLPSMNEDIEYTNEVSQGGQLLGRTVVRKNSDVEVTQMNVELQWARDTWQAFLDVAEQYPAFFWRALEDRAEVVYGSMVSRATQTTVKGKFVQTQIKLEGIAR